MQEGKAKRGSYGSKVTDYLAELQPVIRAKASELLSESRDGDAVILAAAKNVWEQDMKPFFQKAGAAIEIMDEL